MINLYVPKQLIYLLGQGEIVKVGLPFGLDNKINPGDTIGLKAGIFDYPIHVKVKSKLMTKIDAESLHVILVFLGEKTTKAYQAPTIYDQKSTL
jgi:hypothetical protein